MSVVSVSCSDGPFFGVEIDEDYFKVEQLALKTQSIWERVSDCAVGAISKVIHVVRNAIGSVARDVFFFPLKWSRIANMQIVKEQMAIEEGYYRDFWDPSKPLDPNLKDHAKIRETFAPPEDRVIPIQLNDGRVGEITCRIIQTKESGDTFYNFVQVPGVYSTISNNIATTQPYLSAYLNEGEEGAALPPARFIVISENNLNFKPATIDEAGFVLLETLKALKAEFGEIDQLVAHSLGTIFLSNALKQTEDPKDLPKRICLDRGPTSTWEVCKHYAYYFSPLMFVFAKAGQWAFDVERDVVEFTKKWEERPSLLVTGVLNDHHFYGAANLCQREKIKDIENADVLLFNPPLQFAHEHAHHNLKPDLLNPRYLVGKSDYMQSSENLAEAIIRHSLER